MSSLKVSRRRSIRKSGEAFGAVKLLRDQACWSDQGPAASCGGIAPEGQRSRLPQRTPRRPSRSVGARVLQKCIGRGPAPIAEQPFETVIELLFLYLPQDTGGDVSIAVE